MDNIILKMPITESDSNTGINDGGIETYKNKPMLSLTKEELQNSTDGAQRINDQPKQVVVEFNDYYIDTKQIPSYDKLLEVYEKERDYWDDFLENDKKAVEFFENGIQLLKKDKIRVLRISDFNTTGLLGVHGKSTPWRNLVKNKFVSDKTSSSGGSFGIGKDAAFACSELRTVFYNTYNQDGEKAFQGAIKLPSYRDDDKNYDGFGFFSVDDGTKNSDPVLDCISLDPNFNRSEYGMDKYIIGFNDDTDKEELKKQLIVSSIDNFLYAFYTEKLVVKYGETIVNKENLDSLFEKYHDDIDSLTVGYYETLKNPDNTIFVTVFEENDVKIFVKLGSEFNKRRAAVVRQSGMKVFDKGSIEGHINFSALIILTGDEVNAYFKKLENAEHTQWSEFRGNKNEAKKHWDKFYKALRNEVRNLNHEEYGETIDSDGLNEYLPMEYVAGKKNKVEGLTNEIKEKKKKAKKNKKKSKVDFSNETITYDVDERGEIVEETIDVRPGDGDIEIPGGNNYIPQGGQNGGRNWENYVNEDGGAAAKENPNGKFISSREVPRNNLKMSLIKGLEAYNFKLISKENIKKGYIDINISGEQGTVKTNVKSAMIDGVATDFKQNKIYIGDIQANEKHSVSFELDDKGVWTLEVSVHESKN